MSEPRDRSAEVKATLERQRRWALLDDHEALRRVLAAAKLFQEDWEKRPGVLFESVEKNEVAIERVSTMVAKLKREPDPLHWPVQELRMVAGADVPQIIPRPDGEAGRYWPDHQLQCPDFSVRVTVLSNGDIDLHLENQRILPGHGRMVNLPARLLTLLAVPRPRHQEDCP